MEREYSVVVHSVRLSEPTKTRAHETIDALYNMMQNKRGGANTVAARFIGWSTMDCLSRAWRM